MTEETWAAMVAYANEKGLKSGDYKKLNLPFENRFWGQESRGAGADDRRRRGVRLRPADQRSSTPQDTAPLAIEAILEAGSHDLGPKSGRIEDAADWTPEKIRERATTLHPEKGPKGNFED